ncbi:unnamed protein product [Coffea canephora]|uniref:Uncharacterized protein n=1 Tax=Coffea canephora TaxID=49390 RepID=A0A068UUQ7_COFCA|nr:unnamed protein product [Coffea canephora]
MYPGNLCGRHGCTWKAASPGASNLRGLGRWCTSSAEPYHHHLFCPRRVRVMAMVMMRLTIPFLPLLLALALVVKAENLEIGVQAL